MADVTSNRTVDIYKTAHGKYYYVTGLLGDEVHLPDALDFPGRRVRDDFVAELKGRHPDIRFLVITRQFDFVTEIRSVDAKVSRDSFVEVWREQMGHDGLFDSDVLNDPFRRVVRVELSGKDKVPCWSGWFHYPLLIEGSRRQMRESAERLVKLFESDRPWERDVIEEAYYEQVMRERLAIFERRREWWRVIRWGSTTVLVAILAAWSLMQIVDRLVGG